MNDNIKSISTDLKTDIINRNRGEIIVSSESGFGQSHASKYVVVQVGFKNIEANAIKSNISSKTEQHEYISNQYIENKIKDIFYNAEKEEFSEDIKSNFSIELENIIEEKGNQVLYHIEDVLKNIDKNIVYEFLRCIGNIDSPTTLRYRKNILLKHLSSSDNLIILGAVLGISFLSDKDLKSLQNKEIEEIIISLKNIINLDNINSTLKNYINTTINYINNIK